MSTEPGARTEAAAGGSHLPLAPPFPFAPLAAPDRPAREHAIEALKTAFVQDRLAKDEFEERLARVLTSRSHAELSAVIDDLPAWLVAPRPLVPPARPRSRVSMNKAVTGGACLVIAANMSMLFAILTGSAAGVVLVAVLTVIGAAIAIGVMIVAP